MKILTGITAILLGSVLFIGCIGVDREFVSLRNDVMSSVGEKFDTSIQFSVGKLGLSFASFVVNTAHDEKYVSEMIDNISNVKIGVYTRDLSSRNSNIDYSFMDRIDEQLKKKGYQFMVRSREYSEVTLIYVNNNPDEFLNDLFVINLTDEELVMVDITGKLDRVVQIALEEKNIEFEM